MTSDTLQISAMLARGIDPATGRPMQETLPPPQRLENTANTRAGSRKPPARQAGRKAVTKSSTASAIRFTIIEEPKAPAVRDDLDVLAIILPLDKYLARRRASPDGKLKGANRYRRTALIALEQQWTIEYWRARALHFERLQGIRDALGEPPALRHG